MADADDARVRAFLDRCEQLHRAGEVRAESLALAARWEPGVLTGACEVIRGSDGYQYDWRRGLVRLLDEALELVASQPAPQTLPPLPEPSPPAAAASGRRGLRRLGRAGRGRP